MMNFILYVEIRLNFVSYIDETSCVSSNTYGLLRNAHIVCNLGGYDWSSLKLLVMHYILRMENVSSM